MTAIPTKTTGVASRHRPAPSDEDDVFIEDDSSDDGACPQALSDNGSVFVDDGDTNSSNYDYSPASPSEATSEGYTDPAPTHDGPFHTSPQPPEPRR